MLSDFLHAVLQESRFGPLHAQAVTIRNGRVAFFSWSVHRRFVGILVSAESDLTNVDGDENRIGKLAYVVVKCLFSDMPTSTFDLSVSCREIAGHISATGAPYLQQNFTALQ